MHADHHIVRPVLDRLVHHPRIAVDQPIGVLSFFRLGRAVLGIAEVGKENIVHLQVAAAGIVECAHGLGVGGGKVGEQGVGVLIFLRVDVRLRNPEMAAARTGDRDFRHHVSGASQKAVMLQHRVIVGEVELSRDGREDRTQLHAVELHALVAFFEVQPLQPAHEIIVPERTPDLAVGHDWQPGVLLHAHYGVNSLVLNRLELFGADRLFLVMALSRILHGLRPKQASNMVGAERRPGCRRRGVGYSVHDVSSEKRQI